MSRWRPTGQSLISATALMAKASDANRHYDVGSQVFVSANSLPYWLKANGDWVDWTGTTYTPTLMAQTTALLAAYTALGYGYPAGSDLDALDRAIYRMVEGGIWSKGRLLVPYWGDDRLRAGVNVFRANVSDPAGHPYNMTIPAGAWTQYRGYLPNVTTPRLSTGLDVTATGGGGWVPAEGLVSGGNFLASIFASTYDHTVTNGYDLCSNNAKAGVRCRSASGAQVRMNSSQVMNFSALTSDSPHMLGATRSTGTAADMVLLDNGVVDTTPDATYIAGYAANAGLPDTFWAGGGNTSATNTLVTSDRTKGFDAIFTPLTTDEGLLWADIQQEWGTSLGYYS